jgi:hypothetical protein
VPGAHDPAGDVHEISPLVVHGLHRGRTFGDPEGYRLDMVVQGRKQLIHVRLLRS